MAAPATLRDYLAFAVNSAAVTCGRSHVAWQSALDTAQRALDLKLHVSVRPSHWKPVDGAANWTVKLVTCNDVIGTADVDVSDGVNEVTIAVCRPMWTYGPGASISTYQVGEFSSRLMEDLGVSSLGEVQVLGVDPDVPATRFSAAAASAENTMLDIEGALPLLGAMRSATAAARAGVLVKVEFNGDFAVSYTPGFPVKAVTHAMLAELMNKNDPVHATAAGIVGSHFPCTDGDLLMLCIAPTS